MPKNTNPAWQGGARRRSFQQQNDLANTPPASATQAGPGSQATSGRKRCRQCGEKFTPAFRAGRDSNRRRPGGKRTATEAVFCSRKCRQANYRWRQSQRLSRNGNSGKGPTLHSAVTRPLQDIEIVDENSTKNGVPRPVQIAGPPLSEHQLHLANLPLDSTTAATVRQANREAYAAKSYLPRSIPPLDVGNAVLLGAGHKIATADIATAGDPGLIPDALRRPLSPQQSCVSCDESFQPRTWQQKNCPDCQIERHP